MKNLISGVLFIALITCVNNIYAQDTSHVIVIRKDPQTHYYYKKKEKEQLNLIKVNPTLIGRGELPILYERKINKKMSMEVGVGPAYLDYTYYVLNAGLFEDDLASANDVSIGPTFKYAVRFYPGKEGFFEGLYFAPEFRYKRYGLTATPDDDPLNKSYTAHHTFTELALNFGDQEEWDDNIYYDYYAGIGIRSSDIERVFSDFDQNTGDKFFFVKGRKHQGPMISLGLKVGFAF